MAADGAGLAADDCHLSLNKKTPIPRSAPEVSASTLGLAHGDLVHLIDKALAAPAAVQPAALPSPPAPPPSTFGTTLSNVADPAPAPRSSPPAVMAAMAASGRQLEAARARAALEHVGGDLERALLTADEGAEPMVTEEAPPSSLAAPLPTRAAAPRGADPPKRPAPPAAMLAPPAAGGSDRPPPAAAATDPMVDATATSLLSAAPPLPPLTLVPQGLVDSLGALLEASGADGPHEAVVVALHLLLCQGGFLLDPPVAAAATPPPPTTSDAANAPAATLAASRPPPPLPSSWRATPGFFNLRYITRAAPYALDFKCIPMGEMLLAHAMLSPADTPGAAPTLLSWQVSSSEHATSRGGLSGTRTLLKLPRLVHAFSTAIVQPLLAALRAHTAADPARGLSPAGVRARRQHMPLGRAHRAPLRMPALPPPTHHAPAPHRAASLDPRQLLDLCPELKFAVLTHVQEALGLTRLSGTCSELRCLALDDLLWTRLYEARFGDPPPTPLHATAPPLPAFASFRRRVGQERKAQQEEEQARRAAREQMEQRRAQMHMPPGYDPHFGDGGFYGGGGGLGGGLPGGIPGIIGGDFDRVPGGGLPPPFGPNPFGGGGGRGGGRGGGLPFGGGPRHPAGPEGLLPPGAVPPGARFDPISPLVDPDGMRGIGGGGVGGGGIGGGMGGMGGPGGAWGEGDGMMGGPGGAWGEGDGMGGMGGLGMGGGRGGGGGGGMGGFGRGRGRGRGFPGGGGGGFGGFPGGGFGGGGFGDGML